jgi:hypothetical protein
MLEVYMMMIVNDDDDDDDDVYKLKILYLCIEVVI